MDNQAYLTELTRELLDLKAEKKAFNKEIGAKIKGVEEQIEAEVKAK